MESYKRFKDLIDQQKKVISETYAITWQNLNPEITKVLSTEWTVRLYNYYKQYKIIPDLPSFYTDVPNEIGDLKDVTVLAEKLSKLVSASELFNIKINTDLYFLDSYDPKKANMLGTYNDEFSGIHIGKPLEIPIPAPAIIIRVPKDTVMLVVERDSSYYPIFWKGSYKGKRGDAKYGYYWLNYVPSQIQ